MDDTSSKLANSPAFWAFAAAVVTQLVNWLINRQKAKLDSALAARTADAESKKADTVDRDAAFKNLIEVVKTLREGMAEVREELEAERAARKAAENTVRELRDEVHSLRAALLRHGIADLKALPAPTSFGDPSV